MKNLALVGLAALPMLAGCGTIIGGTSQEVTVNTNPAGASCVINRKGETLAHIASTPASATIRKAKYDITIVCDKDGFMQATFLDHSGIEGATFGDILLSGGVGWAVDSSTGADNKYDSPVNITLVPNQPPVASAK